MLGVVARGRWCPLSKAPAPARPLTPLVLTARRIALDCLPKDGTTHTQTHRPPLLLAMPEAERDELARSIVDDVLNRIVAWDTRTQSTPSPVKKQQPTASCADVLVPLSTTGKALSYNPCLVPNCSGAPAVVPTTAWRLLERFDDAVVSMDPAELDHDYVRRQPQILSHAEVHLGDEAHVTAYQVRVAKQQSNCRCGHHAFHNALSAAWAITAPTEADALQALADTQSEPAFWSRFNRSLASLYEEAERRGTNSWPWDHNFLDGEVERSHMTHLLRTDFEVGRLGGDSTFLVFQYALGRPMLETESLLACQEAADAFVASPGPCHRCIIVGALSHWVTVVINKVPTAGEATEVEVLLFDSNNTPVLGATDARLAEIAATKAEERGWDPACSKESYYRSSLHDMQSVVTLLARLFSGATDLRAEAVNGAVERMLADFDATASATAQDTAYTPDGSEVSEQKPSSEEFEAEALFLWLQERQPPAVLRSGVLATVQRWGAYLSALNREALQAWAERAVVFSRRLGTADGVASSRGNPVVDEQAVVRRRAFIGLAQVAEAILSAL